MTTQNYFEYSFDEDIDEYIPELVEGEDFENFNRTLSSKNDQVKLEAQSKDSDILKKESIPLETSLTKISKTKNKKKKKKISSVTSSKLVTHNAPKSNKVK
jgi:hypothetical protein